MTNTALVFGASGVSGWAFVNEILNDYPQKSVWSGVHALTNRPLDPQAALWPKDERLAVTSGINLLEGSQQDVERKLATIPGIENVTHVVYLAFKASTDTALEVKENIEMFKRAITAVDRLCPSLAFVVNQTGSKTYGCHLLHDRPEYLKPPFKEDGPRLGPPGSETIFYTTQLEWLTMFAREKTWSWAETRPDIIIGFVPNQNFYSLGMALGFFLALYREKHGAGAECPFPGTDASWEAKCQDSSSDMIARQTIHIMLSHKTAKGQAFNVADERKASTWEDKWPVLCSLFSLKGVKAPHDNPIEVRKFIKENYATWEAMEEKYGLVKGQADNDRVIPGFEYFLLTMFDVDRQFDMSRVYDELGFGEERSVRETWERVFARMAKAKLIPMSSK